MYPNFGTPMVKYTALINRRIPRIPFRGIYSYDRKTQVDRIVETMVTMQQQQQQQQQEQGRLHPAGPQPPLQDAARPSSSTREGPILFGSFELVKTFVAAGPQPPLQDAARPSSSTREGHDLDGLTGPTKPIDYSSIFMQVPEDFFSRVPIPLKPTNPHRLHYIFVIQFGSAHRYLRGWSIYKVSGPPTAHGMWLCPDPRDDPLTDYHIQEEFDENLIDFRRTVRLWPSYEAFNNDPLKEWERNKKHLDFWENREWNPHGRYGPMNQKNYIDFVLDGSEILCSVVHSKVKETTIHDAELELENGFLDVDQFLIDMHEDGYYPTLHSRIEISKEALNEKSITSELQLLCEARFYLDFDDPRITLDPSTLNHESDYDPKLDMNIFT